MKCFKIFICTFVALTFFQLQSKAQVIDSLPWVKAPLFINNAKISIDVDFTFINRSVALNTVSIERKNPVPRGVRIVRAPLTLKRGEFCYRFKCVNVGNCNNCLMMWKDLNRDGKVQPRRELRCGCPGKRNSNCKVAITRVRCN